MSCRECGCPDQPGHPSYAALLERIYQLENRVAELDDQRTPPASSDPDFVTFWDLYPRKVQKAEAARAWHKMPRRDRKLALAAAPAFAAAWAAAAEERLRYIKHPASWLRARAWEDGEAEWRRVAGTDTPAPKRPPLVGQHKPTGIPLRDVEEDSPDWVRATASAIGSLLRPDVPDDLATAYFRWRKGEELDAPAGWADALFAAWEEARKNQR